MRKLDFAPETLEGFKQIAAAAEGNEAVLGATTCSLCRGLGTVDDETPWGVMQSPCPDCNPEEND